MDISEVYTVIKTLEYSGEKYINLVELDNLLKTDILIEMEECLITPYYIHNNKRLELYQYEFCCTDKVCFEEYILNLTGKEKTEDIPEEIWELRKKCFSMCGSVDTLVGIIEFLFNDQSLKKEIEKIFGSCSIENLYAIVY